MVRQIFSIGQRWVSGAELQLGLGIVVAIQLRTVSMVFPATAEKRVYARESAPLTRVRFNPGDWIQDQKKQSLQVIKLEESNGLIVYHCQDQAQQTVCLPEGELNSYLQLNRPGERLLNGQVDRNEWFLLRTHTRSIANRLLQSPVYGLAGCRTSLIAHQLYIAHEVSRRFAPRVLLADEVGLGKTIEAGLILHQQLLLERVHRVLIIVPESLLHQWLVEMLRRFNLMFSVFDAARCEAIQASANEVDGHLVNPFQSEQLVICSLQFLMQHPQRSEQVLRGEWDLLVVDEAHHLAWTPESVSPEYRIIETLASRVPGVLLLTATPEQLGKAGHFARLRLLDPNRFNDLERFLADEAGYGHLADLVEVLQEDTELDDHQWQILDGILANEAVAIRNVAPQAIAEQLLDRHGTGRILFRNTRQGVQGFPVRERHAYALNPGKAWQQYWADCKTRDADLQVLLSPELLPGMVQVWMHCDPRINWLGDFLRSHRSDKVLVICSSANTALVLVAQLKRQYGLRAAIFHEGMSLLQRDRSAADFADHDMGAAVLICSEIGSEGRNFQFSQHLVLFDLPLNPDLLEQRIGRLDRIGQQAVINIHVPYLQHSAQAVMFRWYDEGLDAFRHTCPAGLQVYRQTQTELDRYLREPQLSLDAFITRTNSLHQVLNRTLQQGRDRLLEANSCRSVTANTLIDLSLARDHDMDIFAFMEHIYDCYGINSDIRGENCWVITPDNNMLTKIPGLPDDGMTVTYCRETALSHEDVHFLSWEHPFVRNVMDLILSHESGNTALIAIKYTALKPGSLILDSHFLIDFSDKSRLGKQRYFPNSSINIVLDEQGRQHGHRLDRDTIKSLTQRVDVETAIKIINLRRTELANLLQAAEVVADQQCSGLVDIARQRGVEILGGEIDRLQALQRINASVRNDEIKGFREQLTSFENSLGHARLRLDAVRVMVVV